jgi:nitronate monooxygenase
MASIAAEQRLVRMQGVPCQSRRRAGRRTERLGPAAAAAGTSGRTGAVTRSMTLATPFTQLVGCRVPIQLAAMGGGVTTPQLAITVTRAGGLGMLQSADPVPLGDRIETLERADAFPFGVNFVIRPGAGWAQSDVEMAAARARVVEFFWDDPDDRLVDVVHRGGALASWQVGTVEEAQRAEAAGCDIVVAQGSEAGGHVRGNMALLPLLAGVLDVVDTPVVAAGGISNPRSMAAAIAAGASGVRVGTRFLATTESGAHPRYVAALVRAGGDDTVMTTAFGVGWPDAQHRVLRTAVDGARALDGGVAGWVAAEPDPQPIPAFSSRTPSEAVTGSIEAMAMYAGQGVGHVKRIESAADVVAELSDGAERLLMGTHRWRPGAR